MGHSVDYITVDKRSDIMKAANEYAFYNTDRGENPSGSYHGNMHIHDSPICENYEEALEMINKWDTGWYSDHAVQYKDKSVLKPTKAMLALMEKASKLAEDKKKYAEAHSIKNRKSEYIGCVFCGSKLSKNYLRGDRCPVCGTGLLAGYIVARIKKYDKDRADALDQYFKLQNKQEGKCPIKWLVKVEVHC